MAPVAAETVAQCETNGRLIAFGSPWDLSRMATSFPLPKVDKIEPGAETRPAVIRVTVDSGGKVIEVLLQDGKRSGAVDAVVASIWRWTFRPSVYNGRQICMGTTVYVYLRNRQGAPELIISRFTDRDRPPGEKR